MTLHLTKIPHREDIQALRAIAVIAVVFFHAGVPGFQGGYVGVDIFFVISGYLITNILANEVKYSRKISFSSFYSKRVCRILPALLFTLFLTTIFSSIFFPSYLLSKYGESLISSALSIANIYFYTQSGYFDSSASLKPLLHIWSLGVEEQFYLIWPLFIGLILSKKFTNKETVPILVIAIGLVSLGTSQYLLEKDSAASFFLMPFRVFEFSLGAIICWIKIPNNKFIYYFSIILIAYPIIFFNEKTQFPGLNALIPCMGAAFFIYSDNRGRINLLYRYLGLSYLGKISYSLYLVHWPIIVFWLYLSNISKFTRLDSFLVIITSLFFGSLSYYLVEKFYKRRDLSNTKILASCLIITIALVIIGITQSLSYGWNYRSWISSEIIDSETLKKGKDHRFSIRQKICNTKGWANCDDVLANKFNVLVIGDSHAVDALNALENQFPDFNYSLSTLGGCPPSKDITEIAPNGLPDIEQCKALNRNRHDVEYLNKFNLIVINNLMGWFTPDHLVTYLTFLHNNGVKNVIVFGNYLSLNIEMPILINKYGYDETEISKSITLQAPSEEELKQKCIEYDYIFISKKSVFCENKKCRLFDNRGTPFTYDAHHLSFEFSIEMLVNYKQIVGKYISRDNILPSQ
jgi:peptidoglycan/LPS O-acetylase OafA/YrhL